MLSYRLTAFGQPLQPVETPTPRLEGTQVLLAIEACGVCHSDLHIWEGYFDLGNERKIVAADGGKLLPLTLGHEIAGTVAALGPDAQGAAAAIAVGDKRMVFPWIGCGQCLQCKAGDEHICNGKAKVPGIFADGGYASHIVVPHPRYLLDYAGLPTELACTYACSGLTAFSALKKVGRLQPDAPLLIVGAGGVGLNAVRMAKSVTGQAPIVADIDAGKRAAALAAGADQVVDPAADGALRSLLKATGGVAAAIDFVGAPKSFEFAYGAVRKGGRMVMVGLLGGSVTLSLPLVVMRAITIMGSYVGSLVEMRELLDLARRDKSAPLPIATRPLAEANRSLADLKAGKVVGRVVLTP
jgi:D-arabinose 1-dehydrogenase-like Zn-dependent alcohol dehydrogenase